MKREEEEANANAKIILQEKEKEKEKKGRKPLARENWSKKTEQNKKALMAKKIRQPLAKTTSSFLVDVY